MRKLAPLVLIANGDVKVLGLCPLVVLLLLSQGCVGFYVRHTQDTTINDPVINNDPKVDGVEEHHPMEVTNSVEYTTAWLEGHWGKPTSVRPVADDDGGAIWTYKFRHCWCGLIPTVIVPIPLMLPVGREKVLFVVRKGRVVGAVVVVPWTSGSGANWFTKWPRIGFW
jgi:hypothetical protein